MLIGFRTTRHWFLVCRVHNLVSTELLVMLFFINRLPFSRFKMKKADPWPDVGTSFHLNKMTVCHLSDGTRFDSRPPRTLTFLQCLPVTERCMTHHVYHPWAKLRTANSSLWIKSSNHFSILN